MGAWEKTVEIANARLEQAQAKQQAEINRQEWQQDKPPMPSDPNAPKAPEEANWPIERAYNAINERLDKRTNSARASMDDPNVGPLEAAGVVGANMVGVGVDVLNTGVEFAIDQVVPDFIGKPVEDAMAGATKYIIEELGDTPVGEQAIAYWGSLSPRAKRNWIAAGAPLEALLMGTGFGKAKKAINAPENKGLSDRGMFAASTNNYIPNFYNEIKRGVGAAGSYLDRLLESPSARQAVKTVAPLLTKEKIDVVNAAGASKKGMGVLNTLGKAATEQFKNLLDPKKRALWADHRVTANFQREASELMARSAAVAQSRADVKADIQKRRDSGEEISKKQEKEELSAVGVRSNRERPKAGALAILQSHVAEQHGITVPPGSPLDKFRKAAFLKSYEGWTPTKLQEWFLDSPSKKGNKKITVSERVAKGFSQIVESKHKIAGRENTIRYVMKRPESILTGKHKMDAFGGKNFNAQVISDAFSANNNKAFKTDEQLKNAIELSIKNRLKKSSGNPPFSVKVEIIDGELFLKSARPGSAVVEGGIRSTHHVPKDGKVSAVLSDEHDFLEKSGVGRSKTLVGRNNVIAVTPPMFKNYVSKHSGKLTREQSDAASITMAGDDLFKQRLKEDGSAESLMEDLINLKPSQSSIDAYTSQTKGAAGAGGMLAVLGVKPEEQEP